MSNSQVDYDRIAPSYDRRFADGGLGGVAAALSSLAETHAGGRILEVGCGTGHWLAGLSPAPGHLVGLDLSAGMLAQAQRRGRWLHLTRGSADRLPFPDVCFDLVYCVNALHHFQQQCAFVSEARRLLRPGGALAVVGMDPRTLLRRWYIYDYFEGTYDTDLARFPSWGTVADWMVVAGFKKLEWQPVERILDQKRGSAILADPFLLKDSCSQLALLTDEAYAAGLGRMETALAAAEAAGKVLTFPVDLILSMLVGWI